MANNKELREIKITRRKFLGSASAFATLSILPSNVILFAIPNSREFVNLSKEWKFQQGNHIGAELPGFDDSKWRCVNIPHDWRINEEFNEVNPRNNGYLPKGQGWYRKELFIDPINKNECKCFLEFEGVFRNCTIWINGEKAGSHLAGYTGFVLDITDLVDFHLNKNLLAVFVDNVNFDNSTKGGGGSEGWWYEGYGIYRNVKLIMTNPIYIPSWGTFIYTENVSADSALVKMKINIRNDTDNFKDLIINTIIVGPEGEYIVSTSSSCYVDRKSNIEINQETFISNPELWDIDDPRLYKAVTYIYSDGEIVDKYNTSFGIRWFEFTSEKGFYLNGKHVQLRGMCIHHDYGGLGCALPDRANYHTIEIAKEMGVNFIRSSHNDASPSLMNACDELGVLFWAETRYFGKDDNSIAALVSLVRRARNHPSIICWSLANTGGSDDIKQTEILQVLNNYAKKEDSTRPTAFGCEGNGDPNKSGFALVTDIMGYNGGGMGKDDRDHILFPDRKMIISEYSSGRGARGNYKREILGETEILGDGRIVSRSGQLTSIYDLCRSHEREWRHIAERPHLAGGAMWSGIEYMGETNGWPIVTSQFGVLDLCRFRKDTYYFYLQEWTDKPMVHIFPHWNWNDGDLIDVWCYSNCDEVELVLNDESLGKKPKLPLSHIEWKVPFRAGVLYAKGYNNGIVVVESEIKTAGNPHHLMLSADRMSIKADGEDIVFITIRICDNTGSIVPTADNMIDIETSGGQLIGICSGNPMSHENPGVGKMKAFNGMLLAIVQSYEGEKGLLIKVKSEGLDANKIFITTE